MKNSLLTNRQKQEIEKLIKEEKLSEVISILEKIKTQHAGTAKTQDKRYVIKYIVKNISENSADQEKDFFNTAIFFCKRKEDVAKEIGISLIWKAYNYNPEEVKAYLIKIANDPNWEVREYAGNAFANINLHNKDIYKTMLKWTKHPSENVRRAVVFSTLGLRKKETLSKAFSILERLMSDSSNYVKKNLGPFILGSYFGNKFPAETLMELRKWSKLKDVNVRWNVIMAFNNSFGNNHPEKALSILKYFTSEVDPGLKRALGSTLRILSKHHPKSVDKFKLKHMVHAPK